MKRVSPERLRTIRNDIDVLRVILALGIPTRSRGSRTAFRCPRCRRFRSAVCRRIHLARCFRCHRSFNVIDLVLAERPCGFRDAVRFLDELLVRRE